MAIFVQNGSTTTLPEYAYKRRVSQPGSARENGIDIRLVIKELHGYVTDFARLEIYVSRLAEKFSTQQPERYFSKVAPYVAVLHQLMFIRDVHEYCSMHVQ